MFFVFVFSRAWDKENNLHEESNLRASDSALRCSTTEPQRLYGDRTHTILVKGKRDKATIMTYLMLTTDNF